jgi:hypothetical protein
MAGITGRKGDKRRARPRRATPGPLDSIKAFMALPDQEKERIWASFAKIRASDTRALTREERELWERAKRKRGRPRTGKGVRVISLSVERGLLEKADAFAKEHGMTRAALFAKGLEAVVGNGRRRRAG